jgi:hypothetical protein
MNFIRNAATQDRNRRAFQRRHAAAMTIDLKRGNFLRVRDGAGGKVTARAGSVWLTEQGGGRDVVLAPGRSFTLRQNGLALIEAFSDASVSYEP